MFLLKTRLTIRRKRKGKESFQQASDLLLRGSKATFTLAVMRNPIVKRVVRAVGTARAVGEACGITGQAVSLWRHVPIEHVFTVERISGIPREELRPDIFGAPRPLDLMTASRVA